MLTESDSRDGAGVGGGGGGWGECNGRSGESPWSMERGRGLRERRAEARAFAVMDGLSSSRDQKPNLPRHRWAAARGAATQELIGQ